LRPRSFRPQETGLTGSRRSKGLVVAHGRESVDLTDQLPIAAGSVCSSSARLGQVRIRTCRMRSAALSAIIGVAVRRVRRRRVRSTRAGGAWRCSAHRPLPDGSAVSRCRGR
jgi:hypothetical protein